MAVADYLNVVQTFYIAYFGRPADPTGLQNAAALLNSSGAPTTTQGLLNAYGTNAAVRSLVDGFGLSQESTDLYAGVSTSNTVTSIYLNLLNRAPDFGGLTYWTNEIDSGRLSLSKVALAIAAGAQANGGADAAVVNNKIAVGANFTAAIDTVAELNAYTGNAAADIARDMLSLVTSTTNVVTFQSTVNATLVAIVNAPPTAVADTAAATEGGALLTGSVATNDNDINNAPGEIRDVQTYATVGTVPAGFTLAADGSYTFDPANAAYNGLKAGQTQNVVLNYSVTDGKSAPVNSTLTVTVTGTNDAPTANPAANSGNEDTVISGSVAPLSTDPDGDVLTYAVTTGVANGTLVLNAATGAYTYTPNANFNGLDSFTYRITDTSGATSTATISLSVADVNDLPVAQSTTLTVAEGAALVNGSVIATDNDPDAVLNFTLNGPAPAGLSFLSDGSFTFDANNAAYNSLAQGATQSIPVSFTVTDDRGATSIATLTINITGTNDAPVAQNDSAATTQGIPVTFNVLANDTDVDTGAVLSIQSASVSAVQGTVAIMGNSLVFTPAPNFFGNATITYITQDQFGAQSAPATASVAVAQANFTLTTGIETIVGTSANDTFLANDTTLNPGDVLDGAGGSGDSLVYAASNSASLSGLQISNIERLVVTQDGVATTGTFDLSGVTGLTTLVDVNSTGAVVFNQVTSLANLELTNLTGPGTNVTVRYQDTVVAGGANAVGVLLQSNQNVGTLQIGSVTVPNGGVETVNLTSGGTSANTITTLDSQLTNLNITGDQNLTITNNLLNNIRNINAGNATGNITLQFQNNDSDGAGEGVTYTGSSGVDNIIAGDASDNISGNNGNDILAAAAGNNIVSGGAGNDTITALGGSDNITGDAGNDNINAGDGNNFVDGGSENDSITTGSGSDNILGGAGNDTITSGATSLVAGQILNDVIDGGTGDDTITASDGLDSIAGGDGVDTISTGGGGGQFLVNQLFYETVNAGNGNDDVRITGAQGLKNIDLGAGDDVLRFNISNRNVAGSVVVGGAGDDLVIVDGIANVITSNFAQLPNGGFGAGSSGVEEISLFNATSGTIDGITHGTNAAFGGNINTGNATGGIFTIFDNLNGNAALTNINNNSRINFIDRGTSFSGQNFTVTNVQNAGAETVSLNFGGRGNISVNQNLGVLTVGGSETLNILANSRGGVETLTIASLNADQTTRLNITGDDNLTINAFTAPAMATIDGSLATGVLNLNGTSFTQNVTILGGTNSDSLVSGSGNDSVVGGLGNDTLNGGAGVETLVGGAGNDVFQFTDATLTAGDSIVGGADTDTVAITGGGVTLLDSIFFRWSSIERLDVSATGTNNTIVLGAVADAAGISTIVGSNQSDTIISQEGFDNVLDIFLGGGNDSVDFSVYYDGAFNPTTVEQQSVLTIRALGSQIDGNDTVKGTPGGNVDRITITSDNGTSTLTNFTGFNIMNIEGTNNANVVMVDANVGAGDSFSVNSTTTGNVNFDAGAETDGRYTFISGSGNDTVLTGNGDDFISTGSGNDVINGGAGADSITAGSGNDFIVGGFDAGDTITAGSGADTVIGGGAGGDLIFLTTGVAIDLQADVVYIDVPSPMGLPAISTINGFDTADTLVLNPILTSGNQGQTTSVLAQGSSVNPATNRLVAITTTAPAAIADQGLPGKVAVASFLQTNNLGAFAVGERAVFALTDGTNTYVYQYISDGSVNTNATEFTQILVINSFTNTAALQLQANYQYTPFDDVGFAAPGTTVDALAGNDLVYLTGTGTVGFTNVESIVGTAGNDIFNSLSSTPANVSVYGNGGFDTFNMGFGQTFSLFSNGTVNGAGGTETIILSEVNPGGLPANVFTAGGPHNLVVNNVEVIDGSASDGDDTITSNNVGVNVAVNLGAGNDALTLGNGSQTVTITNVDVVNGGAGGSNTVNVTDNTALAVNGGTSTMVVNLQDNDGFGQTVTTVSVDTVNGSNDNDTVNASLNVDSITVVGNGGDDFITGSIAASSLSGGVGLDTIFGGDGNDTITGGNDADNMSGGKGDDTISGDAGDDALLGGKGNDTISGGTGNDAITGGKGDDTITGGTGSDTVTANLVDDGVDSVDLGGEVDDRVTITGAPANQIRVTFTSADVGNGAALDGNNAANEDGGLAVRLQAEDGADVLTGPVSRYDDEGVTFVAPVGVTFDVRNLTEGAARGDQFNRVVLGTSAADTFDFSAIVGVNYYINSGGANDVVSGGSGNDFLVGNGGNDTLNGNGGADTLFGVATGDVISGGNGIDQANLADGGVTISISDIESVVGGAGTDSITFTASIVATIDGGGASDTVAGSANADDYTVVNVEVVNTNAGNDIVRLTNVANTITVNGGADSDILLGGNMADSVTLFGVETVDVGDGDDTVRTEDGTPIVVDLGLGNDLIDLLFANDTITAATATINGNAGNDTVLGTFVNDTISLTGVESINSGGGADSVSVLDSTVMTIRLDDGILDGNDIVRFTGQATATIHGGAGTDIVVMQLVGNNNITTINVEAVNASDGNDTVDASGNIVGISIGGGTGNDFLVGGAGNDLFDFNGGVVTAADTLNGNGGIDTIQILSSGNVDLANVTNVEILALTSPGSYAVTLGAGSANLQVLAESAGAYTITLQNNTENLLGLNPISVSGSTNVANLVTLDLTAGLDNPVEFENVININNVDTVNGSSRDDRINGSGSATGFTFVSAATPSGSDSVTGSAFVDTFVFGDGTLTGNDSFDGAAGNDIVRFAGPAGGNFTADFTNVTSVNSVELSGDVTATVYDLTFGGSGIASITGTAVSETVNQISTTGVNLTLTGVEVYNGAAATAAVNLTSTTGANLIGGTVADSLTLQVGGSLQGNGGDDTLNLDVAGAFANRVDYEASAAGNGSDTVNGFDAGAGGDILFFDLFLNNLGSSFNANVGLVNPVVATDFDQQVIRLVDQLGGQDINDAAALTIALAAGGEYANVDLTANQRAVALVADNSTTGLINAFYLTSDGAEVITATLVGTINLQAGQNINDFTAANFLLS